MSSRAVRCTGFGLAALLLPVCGAAVGEAEAQPCANEWSTMFSGDGRLEAAVRVLAVHDGELYLGGEFDTCMARYTYYVARWNGRRWGGVGSGVYNKDYANYVYALVAFSDPNTPGGTLYAGALDGVHKIPDDPNVPNDPNDPNTAWPLVGATDAPVRALAVYQGALYAAGEFTGIAGQTANHIARWNGTAWEEVGGGVGPDPNDPNGPSAKVLALTVFDDGGGEALFAGGTFMYAGTYPTGLSAKRIARWRNDAWSALGDGIEAPDNAEVDALVGWDASGRLYAGGKITLAGGTEASGIGAALYDPNDPNDPWTWSALGAGVSGGAGTVQALAVLKVGGAEALYVGGNFLSPGQRIASWNGTIWSPLADGVNGSVFAMSAYDDGGGAGVYAAGSFTKSLSHNLCGPQCDVRAGQV